MSSQKLAVIALAASSLLAGCVGTGPNTQQGAVTGGALGALAGAIIGNNSGSRNALGGAVIGGALGAIAGGTIGNSVDNKNGTVYDPYATHTVVVEQQPPRAPAPVVEVVSGPRPADNAVWIPGYWDYRGATGYVWTGGHWEIPPPLTHQYVSAHWENRAGTFVFVRGYWR
jgi:YMGG-like Gly-zipper/WXXGXW repeat (2 copies)